MKREEDVAFFALAAWLVWFSSSHLRLYWYS